METLEETPSGPDKRLRWLLLALFLSLAAHAAFIWWARDYPIKTFSENYYEELVPRAFKVDRVEIDAKLLEEDNSAAAADIKRPAPAPIDLPSENIAEETAEVTAKPAKPGQLGFEKEAAPEIGSVAVESVRQLEASAAAALDKDMDSVRESLLAEKPSSPARPALELAESAGRPGAAGDDGVPAGYSNLDDLLAQTGGLSASQAPIFMPSDVLFGYDESFLRPDAVSSLEKLGELIRRNPQARFRIEGHTDSFGGAEYNNGLSLARAESVKSFLVERMAIDPTRIETRGLGSSRPLVPTTGTIEEQQLNRRVEIVILRAEGGR